MTAAVGHKLMCFTLGASSGNGAWPMMSRFCQSETCAYIDSEPRFVRMQSKIRPTAVVSPAT